MSNLNLCQFIGRAGKDPVTRYSSSGDAITNITLAVDGSYKNKSGEKVDKCEWVNIVFYRKIAEIAGEYLKKGSLVYVSGRLETRKWQDKSGQDRYTTEIIATEMKLLGSKPEGQQSNSAGQQQQQGGGGNTGFDADEYLIPF